MPAHATDSLGAAYHKLADSIESKNGEASLQAWNEIYNLSTSNQLTPAEDERLNSELIRNGVLPRLLVDIGAALNEDGDEDLSRDELEHRRDNVGGDVNPATQRVAKYALDNFTAIDDDEDGELSPEELEKFRGEQAVAVHPNANAPYESNASGSGDDITPESKEYYQSVLQRPYASEQEKLAAVEGLSKLGVGEVTLTDEHGATKVYKVQVTEIGNGRSYVHLWDTETNRIVLRGVGKCGHYEQERDRHGNPVPFQGTKFKASNRDHGVVNYEN